jgi:hypothetical protein
MTIASYFLSIQAWIEHIAGRSPTPSRSGQSLEDTLAALSPADRSRVRMLLERIKAFSDNPDERAAAEHISIQATRIWHRRAVTSTTEAASSER